MQEWQPPVIEVKPRRPIRGFWHIGALGDWRSIVREQYRKLRASGLYDATDEIVVGFIGGKTLRHELDVPIVGDPKFKVFATDDVTDFEFPTLARLWQAAQEQRAPYLCYYFHTKGASYQGDSRQRAAKAWREYMEFFNLERWRDCVAALERYETCGVELQCEASHYSGNFWWATSEYIRKLPDGWQYWKANRTDRLAAENYVCLASPNAYCFHDFPQDLYDEEISPEAYRK
jgi:hypothetical protein